MTQAKRSRHPLLAFLIVLPVAVLLFGVVYGNLDRRESGSLRRETGGIMRMVGWSIDMYEADTGQLPSSLSDLARDPGGVAGWEGPYTDRGEMPKDAWDRDFQYVSPGQHNQSFYDLWSKGQNGVDEQGSGDDIRNWKIEAKLRDFNPRDQSREPGVSLERQKE